MPVEMHCHTVFSVDGRCTPEQVVDAAVECGITTLSITEHNHLGSLEGAQARAAERSIRYLAGVELDVDWNGRTYHFLAFGFDGCHPQIRALVEQNHAKYVRNFELYLEALVASEHPVTRTRIDTGLGERYPTNPAPAMTQWYARDFLVDEGVFSDARAYNRTLQDLKQKIIRERGDAVYRRQPRLALPRDALRITVSAKRLAAARAVAPRPPRLRRGGCRQHTFRHD